MSFTTLLRVGKTMWYFGKLYLHYTAKTWTAGIGWFGGFEFFAWDVMWLGDDLFWHFVRLGPFYLGYEERAKS